MDIPLSPALILAKQRTQEFYRSWGADDARQDHPPRPLPGIDPYWTEIYTQSYQQSLNSQQSPQGSEAEDQDIPF